MCMQTRRTTHLPGQEGFTLVELMISLAIFALVIAAIYQTYLYQQQVYLRNEAVVAMQQEGRSGRYFLSQDIRMAGYDPSGLADATIIAATVAELTVEADLDDSQSVGDATGEIIRFALTNDADGNGLADGSPCRLGREYYTRSGTVDTGGGLQPVVEHVDALQLCYELADGTELLAPASSQLDEIRAVTVSMLVRTARTLRGGPARGVTSQTYVSAAADSSADTLTPGFTGTRPAAWTYEDAYQRQLVVFKIRCRNMGLNP